MTSMETLDVVEQGRRLGAVHKRQQNALTRTRAEVDVWLRARLDEGWSLYRCAKTLDISDSALRSKIERQGVPYEAKPKGGPGKSRPKTRQET